MKRGTSTVLRALSLLPPVGPPDHIGEKSTFGEVLPPLPCPGSHVRLNGLPIGLLMPPLEDPEEALNRSSSLGPPVPKARVPRAASSMCSMCAATNHRTMRSSWANRPGSSFIRRSLLPGIPSGLCLGWVCAALAASACRWEGLSDGGDIRRAFLASSGESWSKYTALGTGWLAYNTICSRLIWRSTYISGVNATVPFSAPFVLRAWQGGRRTPNPGGSPIPFWRADRKSL